MARTPSDLEDYLGMRTKSLCVTPPTDAYIYILSSFPFQHGSSAAGKKKRKKEKNFNASDAVYLIYNRRI